MRKGDNFPFYGFPEPCYIKEKTLLVLGLEIFNNYHRFDEEVFTSKKNKQSTKHWADLVESNIFGMLFGQGYMKKEDPVIVLSLLPCLTADLILLTSSPKFNLRAAVINLNN